MKLNDMVNVAAAAYMGVYTEWDRTTGTPRKGPVQDQLGRHIVNTIIDIYDPQATTAKQLADLRQALAMTAMHVNVVATAVQHCLHQTLKHVGFEGKGESLCDSSPTVERESVKNL